MPMILMSVAAEQIGVTKQTLHYYHERGKITAYQAGRILLVDPEVAKKELETAGYYNPRRDEQRRRKREYAATR